MCGIVGYVGRQDAVPILIEGLNRLEYRGYDSAGHALWTEAGLRLIKKTGSPSVVAAELRKERIPSCLGISHTRWATHGPVTDGNAHPHQSSDGRFAIVHNGVVENYLSIRNFLISKGFGFQSETDSEVLVNLIAYHYDKEPSQNGHSRFLTTVRKSLLHIEGTYGIAVLCADYRNEIVGARKGSPLIIAVGKDENMIASDVAAFAGRMQNVVYLDEGQVVHLTRDDFSITTVGDEPVSPVISQVDWDIEEAALGDFNHYMEKEIFEQPVALENSMRGRFSDDHSTAKFGGLNIEPRELRWVDRIVFCACGTAWHACLVAEHLIERYARIPVEVDYASEFRYRNAPLDKNTLCFVISQSGETLDTLMAMREAKRKGYRTLAITNIVGSTIARENDGGIYQHAGPEIGVASTKAFTSQILIAAMMALYLGRLRDLSFTDGVAITEALQSAPDLVRRSLARSEHVRQIAEKYSRRSNFIFLGRHILFPIALEGALKLKEISYIHAEGYPAAEMKHGPLALVSPECPTVILVPNGELFKKTVSNIQEVKARGGPVIAVVSEDQEFPADLADDTITIPKCHDCILPLLATVPVQLLAYYIALCRGCDVDKPRHLAKSVTVE